MKENAQQATCALCGKSISGKGIITHIEKQQFEFDKRDCEAIFSRLTSVYGIDFAVSYSYS